MKIAIVQNTDTKNGLYFKKEHLSQIENVDNGIKTVLVENKSNLQNIIAEVEIILFTGNPHDIDLSQAKKLRWVQSTLAGANDLADYLKDTPVLLTNASGVHPIPIAEYVLGCMLMFSRQLYKAYRWQLQEKRWEQNSSFRPFELHGKVVSILGLGRIGKRIAKLSKGFEMSVYALSHHQTKNDLDVDTFFPYEKLEKMLSYSDFVINCLPLTFETENFFTKKKFEMMKKTAYFINVGRGKTVVESDLINALRDERLAGAALDVFAQEPLPQNSPFWELENVILTPHYSGWTPEFTDRITSIFCKNLQAYLKGEKMPTLMDKGKGY